MRVWLRWSALLCLSLLLWTAAAESVHHHPSPTDAASCAVCQAAHSAIPAPHSTHSTPAFATVGMLHEEAVALTTRLEVSDLDIRGPPEL